MTVNCKIEDLESGWSRFCISNIQTTCEFEFSYLSNPIEELIFILYELSIQKSKSEYRLVFPEEPGQNILYINCDNFSDLSIKITSSPEWEIISNAYNRQNEERLIYYDENETMQNFTKKVFRAIKNYLKLTTSINKSDYEKILNRIELFQTNGK